MRDMQRIESVLSSEQLRQVEEMKKKDQVHIHTAFLSQCPKVPVCHSLFDKVSALDAYSYQVNVTLYP